MTITEIELGKLLLFFFMIYSILKISPGYYKVVPFAISLLYFGTQADGVWQFVFLTVGFLNVGTFLIAFYLAHTENYSGKVDK